MIRKYFLTIVIALLASATFATDYIDELNNATYGDGQHVIYEMNVGFFTQAGTFNAAADKLADLKALGVDIVWLMPIYPRGGGINSPYAATDFQQVNSSYGTIADLKSFVTAAHNLGMQVWLDWVPNHTATNATWVTEHPEYYVKSGGNFVHPNGYGDVYQLNYNNSGLTTAMTDCLKFWIDQADIDGYRCDFVSSPYIPASYWQNAIPTIKNYKSGKTITFLGEADIANDAKGLKNVGFDYDYAWQYQTSLLNFGSTGTYFASLKANAQKLVDTQNNISFGRMVYLTNHDQNWNETNKTLTAKYGANRYPLTVLAHTVWGMPLIYNGQEVGGNQALNYFEDTKINWNNPDTKMLNTIRTLNALKHAVPAFHDGETAATHHTVTWLTSNNNNTNVLAYKCTYGDSEAIVVLNFATSQSSSLITGVTAGEYSLWLDSKTIEQGVSRKKVNLNSTYMFSLEAKGYQVYVKGNYSEEAIPVPEAYTPTIDSESEVSLFFETATQTTYNVWAWGSVVTDGASYSVNGSWPGDGMTYMGQTAEGKHIYKYVFTKTTSPQPEWFIISKNGGDSKIYDGAGFVNHGYYVEGNGTPTKIITNTGVNNIYVNGNANVNDDAVYDLSGRKVSDNYALRIMHYALPKGIYIRNGKKFIVK